MAAVESTIPLLVPQGQIVDYIDGSLRNETPEEYVRQEIEKSLRREYAYARGDVAVEYRIKVGSASKRVDLAIFPEGADKGQQAIWAIIECKASTVSPNDKHNGVAQLQSYLAACVNAEFGLWTNGLERSCYRRVQTKAGIVFEEVADLPAKGRDLESAERPTRRQLKEADSDSLLFAFRRCHNYIAGNQGLQKPEAFWELLKVIFAKITDEHGSGDLQFYATSQERQSLNGQLKVKARLDKLFHEVLVQYQAIFQDNDVIGLDPRVLAYIVSQLQSYSLLASNTDVKGQAYEELVGSNLRGDRGEFFTPRNVCKLAVALLNPSPDDLVLDPACGTGGFLVVAMNHVTDAIEERETSAWKDPDNPQEHERDELNRKKRAYKMSRLAGIDLNPNLVRATKMNMVMNNDGSGALYQGNSLAEPVTWSEKLRERSLIGRVDMLFTNPPFGSKITIDDPAILRQYELAHAWDYDAEADTFSLREPRVLQKSQPPEILFIERCVQFLKPGTGRMAIVLPDGILGAPGLAYVREWILRNTRVLASIDLHPDTFQPGTGTQTSILVLQRKTPELISLEAAAGHKNDYPVFMALANHVGHDKRGNKTYVRDEAGNEVVVTREERVKETQDGRDIYRTIETPVKKEDDNTQEIAKLFRRWWGEQQ